MGKNKIIVPLALGGASVLLLASLFHLQNLRAQTASPRPLKVADVTSVSSSNPAANYPTSANGAIQNDNGGISVWTGNFPTPYTECGHVGIQASTPVVYTTTDPAVANVWQKRNTCNGNIAVGGASGDFYANQTLTLTGTTLENKTFTLDVQVPPYLNLQGNVRFYVDDTGATYFCRADHVFASNRYPNDCDLTVEQALKPEHLARTGTGAVAGNNLCQLGEDSYTTPQDCGNPKTYTGTSTYPQGKGGTYNVGFVAGNIINIRNAGSDADTFRVTLPVNPENRCGVRITPGGDPLNMALPNPISATLDLALAMGETKSIVPRCITTGMTGTSFTYSVKAVSLGAVAINRPEVNSVMAEVSDTINLVPFVACSDSDGGQDTSKVGTGTGIYAGAAPGLHSIFGQEPNPTTPKATTNNYSTYIDHCSTATQINEGYCDADGKLQAIGLSCGYGCGSGACLPAPIVPAGGDATLVGHWKFDGNGNNEVAGKPAVFTVGSANFKTDGGKFGGYGYVPSGSDSFKIVYNSAYDLADSFTIEFWFRQRSNQSFNQNLIYKGSAPNNYNFNVSRWLWNQYNFGPVIAGHTTQLTGYWTQPSNPNQLAHNEWHHVAFTKSPTYHAYYLDGALIGSKEITATQYTEYGGPAKTPKTDIIIGDTAVDTDFDNLKIYSRAITQAEVTQSSGFPPPAPPPPPPPPYIYVPVGTSTVGSTTNIGSTSFATGSTTAVIGTATWAGSTSAINVTPIGTLVPGVPFIQPGIPFIHVPFAGLVGTTGTSTINFFPGTNTFPGVLNNVPTVPALTPLRSGTSSPVDLITDNAACSAYLRMARQTLSADKQYWRDANRIFKNVPENYAQTVAVKDLLTRGKSLIVAAEQSAQRGCKKDALVSLQEDIDFLHGEVFANLSTFVTEMDDLTEVNKCELKLGGLSGEIDTMIVIAEDSTKAILQNLVSRVQTKKDSLRTQGNAESDIGFECETFIDDTKGELSTYRIELDKETREVSQIVLDKLGSHIEKLTQDVVGKQQQIDKLVVQVSDLQKKVEEFSKVATEVSEKLIVSYKALADMEDRFGAERTQILAGKDKLSNKVEETFGVLKNTNCVRPGERDKLATELGRVATVNWIPSHGETLEQRLDLVISSCQAKDLTQNDIKTLYTNIDEAAKVNLADSYAIGLTPFADVPTHEWYYGGMITGYNTGFITKGEPAAPVLRQDALLMTLRSVGLTDKELVGPCVKPAIGTTIKASPYAECAVAHAAARGLTLSQDMTQPAVREELADWVSDLWKLEAPKTTEKEILKTYTDASQIASGNTEAVTSVIANGIMVGRTEGNKKVFGPKEQVNRASYAVVLDKLLEQNSGSPRKTPPAPATKSTPAPAASKSGKTPGAPATPGKFAPILP